MKKLRKPAAMLLAAILLIGVLAPAYAAEPKGFTDVPDTHPQHEEIAQAVEQGLFQGTSATTFQPESSMSRAMLVVVLSRLAGVRVDDSSPSGLSDVPVNTWYSGAVAWAAKAGIVTGDFAAAFAPHKALTWEALAVLLTRYADYACIALPADQENASADETGVSTWALDAVRRCRQAGLLQDQDPKAGITRAEAAAVMVRFSAIQSAERGLDLSAYTSAWTYTPANSFELIAMISSGWGAAKPSPTGRYNDTGIFALENIPYVTNPTMTDGKPLQLMNIYVPEEYMTQNDDGTCVIDSTGSKTVTYYDEAGNETGTYTWTAATAPIVFINTVNGYAGSSRFSITGCNSNIFYSDYISKGFIVVGVDSRGIGNSWGGATTVNDDGLIVGKAPSGIVDLKAAVAFLKYNDDVLAGDSEKIVSLGYSAGGAMSALLGATGDAAEYDSYLKELGAADASNSVYASQVYCPITDLDNGDAAYEWLHMNQTSLVDWSGNPAAFNDYQMALHEAFIAYYVDYIQSLGFELGDDGVSGAYYDELTQKAVDALNHAVQVGQYMGSTVTPETVIATLASPGSNLAAYLEANELQVEDVISWDEAEQTFKLDSFRIFDMGGTFKRAKSVPSLDGSIESGLFGANGIAQDTSVHFSVSYLTVLQELMQSDNAEIAAKAKADYDACALEITDVVNSGVTHLMNPMYYLTGEGTATMAKYWRFGNGTADPDLGSVAAWTLYNQICGMDGFAAEFNLVYGAPHGFADYLSDNYTPEALLTWVAQAAAGDVVSD